MTGTQGQTMFGRTPLPPGRVRPLPRRIAMHIGGVLLLFAGAGLLWQGAPLGRYLTGTQSDARVVSIGDAHPDPANNGRLVHLTGVAESQDRLFDPLLGIEEIAIALIREVEMFQWHERSHANTGGRNNARQAPTTYSYKREWSDRLVDSSSFDQAAQHSNPAFFPVSSETRWADNVAVSAFRLNASLISQIREREPLPLTMQLAEPLPEQFARRADARQGDWLYIGDPIMPAVGDMRIRLYVVRDQLVSILARQLDNAFEPHVAATGGSIEHLLAGTLSASAMLDELGHGRALASWALRVLGLIALLIGIGLVVPRHRPSRASSPRCL